MCIFTYTREELLRLRSKSRGTIHPIPRALRRSFRGCRVGAKVRMRRWRYKPFLPSIIMGNVNSLMNKSTELEALLKMDRTYRECSLFFLTETWLADTIPDSAVNMPGFTLVRADREAEKCGKTKGGGLALHVNNMWCHPGHITVKERICSRDVEVLAVSLRPYYVPREFSHIVAMVVYIPPRAEPSSACDVIQDALARIQCK